MYRFHHRQSHVRAWYIGLVLLLVASIFVIVFPRLLQAHTRITQSPPVVRSVPASIVSTHSVVTAEYLMDVPSGWAMIAPPNVPYTVSSWQGAAESTDSARRLDVYVGSVPVNFAANRLLPVQVLGDQLDPIGYPSDNCVNFTDKTPASSAHGMATSKWDGINFLCDVGNYERDVVVIGSSQDVNTVTLNTPNGTPRRVLLVYIDNSASPDYSIFTAIVRSFRLR